MGVQRSVAMITPISTINPATTTASQSHSVVSVKRAAKSATSATSGTATTHCTNATTAITKKTGIGARRRSTRGNVSPATSARSLRGTFEKKNHPEQRTKSPTASVASTARAKRRSQPRNFSQTRHAPSTGGPSSPSSGTAVFPVHPWYVSLTAGNIGSSLTSSAGSNRTGSAASLVETGGQRP